jgi:hypothetical protein
MLLFALHQIVDKHEKKLQGKHSSLFGCDISDEGKKSFNIETWNNAFPLLEEQRAAEWHPIVVFVIKLYLAVLGSQTY